MLTGAVDVSRECVRKHLLFHHKPFRREIEHNCRMVLADTTWQLRRFQTISRFPFDPATEVTGIAPEVQTAIAFIGITRLKPEPDGCEITQ